MANVVGEYGRSCRGNNTFIVQNYEYWKKRENANGQTVWWCCKRDSFACPAVIKSAGLRVVGSVPEHNHQGNSATAAARQAVGAMKDQVGQQPLVKPSAVVATVSSQITNDVLMALPKRTTLARALRHHRQAANHVPGAAPLPPAPTDLTFSIPPLFSDFLLFDSGPGPHRLLMFGDIMLLDGLARADLWLADGTFKVVPSIFYQLYTIHLSL
jgi:hypothetical protein